ncbi:unnamed protein product [Durusdinium trenchii]|uniref:Uncharacterized protein n=1 Tax=Durusdinium trenchii TaxID=1381693 RepID=A0ABP0H860_9DINO
MASSPVAGSSNSIAWRITSAQSYARAWWWRSASQLVGGGRPFGLFKLSLVDGYGRNGLVDADAGDI